MAESNSASRGARVRRTGIALVHEGELVLPAAGSEAQSEVVLADARSVIHYHFPVEIEVRAPAEGPDPDELFEEMLDRLARALGVG